LPVAAWRGTVGAMRVLPFDPALQRPPPLRPDLVTEATLTARGFQRIAGVDEVGRGPWAGPVVAAAVVVDPAAIPPGLRDSKAVRAGGHAAIAAMVLDQADVAVALVSAGTIDRLGLGAATALAMRRALAGLSVGADVALIDGRHVPTGLPCPATALVKGDACSLSVAAASIVAKALRDRLMVLADTAFPGYGFGDHKGYGTAAHRAALDTLGPCPLHRLSFKPLLVGRTGSKTGAGEGDAHE
jgi:ribonuclease HII